MAAATDDDALAKAFDWPLAKRLFGYVRPYGRLVIGSFVLLMRIALPEASPEKISRFAPPVL